MTTKKKNLGGRPRGARNKVSALDEIQKALSRGTGLLELKTFLWDAINDPSFSPESPQKAKYLAMYFELMKYIHTENLKLELDAGKKDSSEKEISKGENTSKENTSKEVPVSNVAQLSFSRK